MNANRSHHTRPEGQTLSYSVGNHAEFGTDEAQKVGQPDSR